MGTPKPPGELIPGTLDMLILKTVSRGEKHGYAIAQAIQRTSDDVLKVEEGALYPALHRLEVRGWLQSSWGTSENNRRAKFYSLTPAGRKRLKEAAASWDRSVRATAAVLNATPEEI